MAEHKKTSFFYDNSEGNPAELLIDYFMSWTLRCALEEKPENISKTVQEYSKQVLYFFLKPELGGVNLDDIKVKEVETLKQWNKIDLLCAVKVTIKEVPKWFVLTFENKMYTKLHGNQLDKYISAVNTRYPDDDIVKLFIYITTHEKVPPEDKEQCGEKFRALTLGDVGKHLQKKYPERSGNALFDEFWYNFRR